MLVAKAHQAVRPGDVLTFPLAGRVRVVRVLALGVRRGPYVEARTLYEDLSPDGPTHRSVERGGRRVVPIAMFHRLMTLFDGPSPDAEVPGPDALQRAAAVLLVLAAGIDGHVDATERATIRQLLTSRLGVDDAEALLDEAEREAADATDVFSLTRVITDKVEPDRRYAIIEMLWEVVLADGETHDYEANLIRRAAGLLHVDDHEAGEARKRVIERH